MKVDTNGVELIPLTIDGILELLRQVDFIQNLLDNAIHVPVHKLVHKLFDLQIAWGQRMTEKGADGGTLTLPFQMINYLLLDYSLDRS